MKTREILFKNIESFLFLSVLMLGEHMVQTHHKIKCIAMREMDKKINN